MRNGLTGGTGESGSSPARMPNSGAWAAALSASLVFSILLGVGLVSQPLFPHCPGSGSTPPTTSTPIKHLFLLIKENHAFENYFATLPGVLGYPPNGSFPVAYGSSTRVSPFPLNATSTPDLPHDHGSLVASVDGGRMDNFVAQAAADGYPDPSAAVGYYTERQIPQYFAYARNYSVGDEFFPGVLGPTLPNRLFDLAATSENWTTDATPPPGYITAPTILDQFSKGGVSWAYDYAGTERTLTPLYFPSIAGDPCALQNIQPIENLPQQLTSPSPPSLVVLDPSHDPVYSEHPPQNVSLGAQWTAAVVNSIFASPVGSTSAVFIYYDENGGFWDPVAPPSLDSLGDGVRIPLLVVSPWTPAGTVVHTVMDPASLLGFAESNFGLPFLNARVAAAPSPAGFFDFSMPPRTAIEIPTPLNTSSAIGSPAGLIPATYPGGEHSARGPSAGSIPQQGDLGVLAASWTEDRRLNPLTRSELRAAAATGPGSPFIPVSLNPSRFS